MSMAKLGVLTGGGEKNECMCEKCQVRIYGVMSDHDESRFPSPDIGVK